MKDSASLFREITFGLEDSLVSTLGAVTGIAAGTSSNSTVLLAGIVYVAVESLSMIAGSYLSSKAQREIEEHELVEEEKLIQLQKSAKTKELANFLDEKGLSDSDKSRILRIISKNPKWMLEEMAVHELGISPTPHENPKLNSEVMGVSYIIGGAIPILPYAFLSTDIALPISIVFTLLAIAGMGIFKARIGNTSVLRNVAEVLTISTVVTVIGYTVGQLIGRYFNLKLPI